MVSIIEVRIVERNRKENEGRNLWNKLTESATVECKGKNIVLEGSSEEANSALHCFH